MSFYSRILYNNISIDFDRGLSAFSPFPVQVKNVVRSRAGVAQTLNFYRYWNFAIGRLFASADLKNQVMAFWDYVRSGNTFAFWHDGDLRGYWNFEGKSFIDIDEHDATYTRNTLAFYDNPSTGLLAPVDPNAARFPAGKFGRGLLLERAATNLLTKSTEFNDASWNATNFTVTTNYDADGAPVETPYNNGAEKAELTSTSGSFQKDTSTNIGTTSGVFSVYLRTHEPGTKSGTLYIKRVDTDATLASAAITITPFWQRLSVTYVNSGSITADWRVRIEIAGTSGDEFAIWGGQMEAAVDLQNPTTFIYTTTTTASRNADILEYDAPDFFDNEAIKGTICFWYAVHPAGSSNLNRVLLMAEASTGHIITIAHLGGGLVEVTMAQKNGANITLTTSGTFGDNSGAFHHFAFTWDSTIANGLKVYSNGVLIGTSSNSQFSIARTGADFYLGADVSDTGPNGIFDDLEIRRDVLSAGEIADRASGRYSIGYDRNYFPSLMIDEQALGLTRLPALPNWDLEIPVREAL